MWKLKGIGAKNFLSHENTQIEVEQNITTLIYGKNITDRGVDSNGSGKSGILEMVYFCMTGNSLRKVKNKELIRNGQDEATVVIELENPVIPMTLKIFRTIYAKKPTKVKLYENDKLREDLQDLKPNETDKVILEHLEISASDLVNYYLISKEKYTSLLLSSDTQKKEVINRFSKADYIDAVFPKIDEDISVQQNIVDGKVKVKESCEAKIELLTEQIEELKGKDVEAEKEERIKKIEQSIEKKLEEMELNSKSIENSDEAIKGNEEKKKELKGKLGKLPKTDELKKELTKLEQSLEEKEKKFKEDEQNGYIDSIADVKQIVQKAKDDIRECDQLTTKSESTLAQLRKIEMGEIQCPNCQHTFLVGDQELSLEEVKQKIVDESEVVELIKGDKEDKELTLEESEQLLSELETELEEFRGKYKTSVQNHEQKIEEKKRKIREVETKEHDLRSSMTTMQSNIDSFENTKTRNNQAIDRLEKEIEECNNKIEEIKNEPNPASAQIKNLSGQIKDQEKAIAENEEVLEIETYELEDLKEWKMNFKRFKSFLANQSLTLIEQQANFFLDKMKCDNRVQIDGFRELTSGKMKEEISIEITRDNLETESFGKFSGGEKAKVDLSCILAMQTLINTSCVNGGLDLLFCDEILESADGTAMNSIANSLNYVDKTVFMIAQSQPNVDCNMLEVQKENKISKIISHG